MTGVLLVMLFCLARSFINLVHCPKKPTCPELASSVANFSVELSDLYDHDIMGDKLPALPEIGTEDLARSNWHEFQHNLPIAAESVTPTLAHGHPHYGHVHAPTDHPFVVPTQQPHQFDQSADVSLALDLLKSLGTVAQQPKQDLILVQEASVNAESTEKATGVSDATTEQDNPVEEDETMEAEKEERVRKLMSLRPRTSQLSSKKNDDDDDYDPDATDSDDSSSESDKDEDEHMEPEESDDDYDKPMKKRATAKAKGKSKATAKAKQSPKGGRGKRTVKPQPEAESKEKSTRKGKGKSEQKTTSGTKRKRDDDNQEAEAEAGSGEGKDEHVAETAMVDIPQPPPSNSDPGPDKTIQSNMTSFHVSDVKWEDFVAAVNQLDLENPMLLWFKSLSSTSAKPSSDDIWRPRKIQNNLSYGLSGPECVKAIEQARELLDNLKKIATSSSSSSSSSTPPPPTPFVPVSVFLTLASVVMDVFAAKDSKLAADLFIELMAIHVAASAQAAADDENDNGQFYAVFLNGDLRTMFVGLTKQLADLSESALRPGFDHLATDVVNTEFKIHRFYPFVYQWLEDDRCWPTIKCPFVTDTKEDTKEDPKNFMRRTSSLCERWAALLQCAKVVSTDVVQRSVELNLAKCEAMQQNEQTLFSAHLYRYSATLQQKWTEAKLDLTRFILQTVCSNKQEEFQVIGGSVNQDGTLSSKPNTLSSRFSTVLLHRGIKLSEVKLSLIDRDNDDPEIKMSMMVPHLEEKKENGQGHQDHHFHFSNTDAFPLPPNMLASYLGTKRCAPMLRTLLPIFYGVLHPMATAMLNQQETIADLRNQLKDKGRPQAKRRKATK